MGENNYLNLMAKWTEEEEHDLFELMQTESPDYSEFGTNNKRSLWAIQCRIIKICREKNFIESDYVSDVSIKKFDKTNEKRAKKEELDFENKRLQNRLLESLIDSSDLFKKLDKVLEKMSLIDQRLELIESYYK